MDILYQSLAYLIIFPWAALVPAVLFFWLHRKYKLRLVLAASVLWGIYAVYELAILYRVLCDADCNIRVDLLVIYPLLVGISIVALAWIVIKRLRGDTG